MDLHSTETIPQHNDRHVHSGHEPGPEESRYAEYELARSRVFSAIQPLERSVAQLTEQVKEVEDSDEKEYIRRLAKLRQREGELTAVKRFEDRLWGNSPDEHEERSAALFAAIKETKNTDDVLRVMDDWGALPGKNDISKPFTDRTALGVFFHEAPSLTDEEISNRAKSLFSNSMLASRIIEILKKDELLITQAERKSVEIPPYELAPEVYSDDEDDVDVQRVQSQPPQFQKEDFDESSAGNFEERIAELREQIAQAEGVRNEKAVLALEEALRLVERRKGTADAELRAEVRRLGEEEHALTDCRAIVNSSFVRLPLFIQKIIPGGREKLALLERAGIDLRSGASPQSMEFARALKLKAVREKGYALLGKVSQQFAHDLESRKRSEQDNSVRLEVPIMPGDFLKMKEEKRRELDAAEPKRIHARNIRRIIENR